LLPRTNDFLLVLQEGKRRASRWDDSVIGDGQDIQRVFRNTSDGIHPRAQY
jgi:hypothetical protein